MSLVFIAAYTDYTDYTVELSPLGKYYFYQVVDQSDWEGGREGGRGRAESRS